VIFPNVSPYAKVTYCTQEHLQVWGLSTLVTDWKAFCMRRVCSPAISNSMKKALYSFSLCLALFISDAYAQQGDIITSRSYPQGYFRNPLNIAMDASGTFGELRSTHFHAG